MLSDIFLEMPLKVLEQIKKHTKNVTPAKS